MEIDPEDQKTLSWTDWLEEAKKLNQEFLQIDPIRAEKWQQERKEEEKQAAIDLDICERLQISLLQFRDWFLEATVTVESESAALQEGKATLRVPLNRVVQLDNNTPPILLAKCVAADKKSFYHSGFNYDVPLGTILREPEFDHSYKSCSKGIHLVFPANLVEHAIRYHYLSHQPIQICLCRIPSQDTLDGSGNHLLKSIAYEKVPKFRVRLAQLLKTVELAPFSPKPNPATSWFPQEKKLPASEVGKASETFFPPEVQKADLPFHENTKATYQQLAKDWEENERDWTLLWENLAPMYVRLLMSYYCDNLEEWKSYEYSHFYCRLKSRLGDILLANGKRVQRKKFLQRIEKAKLKRKMMQSTEGQSGDFLAKEARSE